jgi:hypothetical protein
MIKHLTEKSGKPLASPCTHRNEFPTRYSLAGCSSAVEYQTHTSGQRGKEQDVPQLVWKHPKRRQLRPWAQWCS